MSFFLIFKVSDSRRYFKRNRSAFLFMLAFSLLLSVKPAAWGFEDRAYPGFHGSQADKKILEGINLLYDERFDEAADIFMKVIAESPKKPGGYFYMAMVSWSRLASGFWSPDVVDEFRKRIDRTLSLIHI